MVCVFKLIKTICILVKKLNKQLYAWLTFKTNKTLLIKKIEAYHNFVISETEYLYSKINKLTTCFYINFFFSNNIFLQEHTTGWYLFRAQRKVWRWYRRWSSKKFTSFQFRKTWLVGIELNKSVIYTYICV